MLFHCTRCMMIRGFYEMGGGFNWVNIASMHTNANLLSWNSTRSFSYPHSLFTTLTFLLITTHSIHSICHKQVYSSSLILSPELPLPFYSPHLNWSATRTLECTAPVKCLTICSYQLHFHERINRVRELLHLRKIPCRDNEDLEGRSLIRSEYDDNK